MRKSLLILTQTALTLLLTLLTPTTAWAQQLIPIHLNDKGNHNLLWEVVLSYGNQTVHLAGTEAQANGTTGNLTLTYNGKAYEPKVEVYYQKNPGYGFRKIPEKYYDVSYDNNTNVTNLAKVTITTKASNEEFYLLEENNTNYTDYIFQIQEVDVVEKYFIIDPAPLTVTADDKEKYSGEADPTFTATVTGLQNNETIETANLTFNFTREKANAEDGEEVGEYTITPSGDEFQGNYKITEFVPGKLTINAAMTEDVVIDGFTFTKNDAGEYLITCLADWNNLADFIEAGHNCAGMTFKMTADVGTTETPVTRSLGYDKQHRFAGTFDGGNHTLTIDLNWDKYCSPFAYVESVTIKNLHVAGTITSSGQFASGLVGQTGPDNKPDQGMCTIDNCRVSVEMNTSTPSGNGNHGGFIGIAEGKATIINCVFDGTIAGTNYKYSGGFIGMNKADGTTLTNCLFDPQSIDCTNIKGSCEFVHDIKGTHVLDGCYWVTHFGEVENSQGLQVYKEKLYEDVLYVYGEPVATFDDVSYYIRRHNKYWQAIQNVVSTTGGEVILGTTIDGVSLPEGVTEIVACAEDGAIVFPVSRSFTLNGYTLNRGLTLTEPQEDGYAIKVKEGAEVVFLGGGTITGGNNTDNGGGIYIEENGTCEFHGELIIKDNYANNGGGIYSAGTLIINDNVNITDNMVRNNGLGGGILLAESGDFSLQNGPLLVVKNNKSKSNDNEPKYTNNNVYLASGKTIVLGSNVASKTSVSVTLEDGTGVVAKVADGVEIGSPERFFKSDKGYAVQYDAENREVYFAKQPLPTDLVFTVGAIEDGELIYKGEPIIPSRFTIKSGSKDFTKECDKDWSLCVNAGSATVVVTAKEESIYEGEVTIENAFTIEQRPVTITANDQSFTYGSGAFNDGVDQVTTSEGGLVAGHVLTDITLTASNGEIVPSEPTIMSSSLEDATEVTNNYAFNYVNGALNVTPITDLVTVTIKGNSNTTDYDGEEHEVTGYTVVEVSNPLYQVSGDNMDFTFSGTAQATRKEAGKTNMELTAEQFTNINEYFTSVTFDVTDGYQEILRKAVTVTAEDKTKEYGDEDPDWTAVVEGVVEGESEELISYYFGELTAGEVANTFVITPKGNEEQGNYTVSFVTGTLTVTPRTKEVVVHIVGANNTTNFDGEEHEVIGYTATADFDLYDVNADFTFNGEAYAAQTETGTKYMGLTAENFANTNENFAKVRFDVTDGYQTITSTQVIVTITGNHRGGGVNGDEDWAYYIDAVYTVTGYTWKADNDLYKKTDFTFSGNAKVQSKELGKHMMKLKKAQFENTNANFDVTFEIQDGYLDITYYKAILDAEVEAGVAKVINKVVGTYASKADVTVARTFTAGKWYTICLPFNVTVADSPLADAEVREMSEASFNDGIMTLNFEKVTEMEAGKPYVINFASVPESLDFEGAEFSKVLTDVTVGPVTFKGTYTPVEFEENKSVLLVGDNNNLFYPKNAYVNSLRGYFLLDGIEASDLEEESAPAFVLNFGDATVISNVNMEIVSNEYYDLSGRRIEGVPTERGIYIVNGKKVIVK